VIAVMITFRKYTKIPPEHRTCTHWSSGGQNHNLYSSYQLFGEISIAEVSYINTFVNH
jgi:hypothetical protein